MKKILLSMACLAVLSACSSSPTVQTDQASSVDMSSYKTYSWLSKPGDGVPPLVAQRIVDNVNTQLQAKGWSLQESGGAVSVVAHVATKEKQTLDTMYMGPAFGGWGWRGGMGMGMGMAMADSTTTVHTYDVGTLIVDMFDTQSKQAVWRGTSSETIPDSPEKVNAAIQAAVAKMFAGFPSAAATAK